MIRFSVTQKNEIRRRASALKQKLGLIIETVHSENGGLFAATFRSHKHFLNIAGELIKILNEENPDYEKASTLAINMGHIVSASPMENRERIQPPGIGDFFDKVAAFAAEFAVLAEKNVVLPGDSTRNDRPILNISDIFLAPEKMAVPQEHVLATLQTETDREFYRVYWCLKSFLASSEGGELEKSGAPVGVHLLGCINISLAYAEDYVRISPDKIDEPLSSSKDTPAAHALYVTNAIHEIIGGGGKLDLPPYTLFEIAQELAALVANRLNAGISSSSELGEAVLRGYDTAPPQRSGISSLDIRSTRSPSP